MDTLSIALTFVPCWLISLVVASAAESASLSGKVVDEAGQPIAAAQVTIDLIHGNPHPSTPKGAP